MNSNSSLTVQMSTNSKAKKLKHLVGSSFQELKYFAIKTSLLRPFNQELTIVFRMTETQKETKKSVLKLFFFLQISDIPKHE